MKTRSNGLVAGVLLLLIGGMAGLSFAAVPLYRMFCEATGYAGTPQLRGAAGPGATGRTMAVRFNATTSPNLPWRFVPGEAAVTVELGEDRLAYYVGQNRSQQAVTGVATYNVTPEKAGRYFHKTACFCFDEQTLAPGERFVTRSAGGGAVGDPLRRPAEKVLRDVIEQRVTLAGALDDYGVAIDPDRLVVDAETTAAVRRARSAA